MEAISSELLDAIEDYLAKRVDITLDGTRNQAMTLLNRLQNERTGAMDEILDADPI